MKQLPNFDRKLKMKIVDCWGRDTEKSFDDQKPSNLKEVLGGKLTLKFEH